METQRLLFRHHIDADLEPYCAMESDPIYRAPQVVHPRAELERSFREGVAPPKPMGLMATVLKSNGAYLGRCGLYPVRDDSGAIVDGEANLAYYLARPYWGQGFASEAACAFVRHGFEERGLWRIVAGVNAENTASLRVLQKAGFWVTESGEGGGSRWYALEVRKGESLTLRAFAPDDWDALGDLYARAAKFEMALSQTDPRAFRPMPEEEDFETFTRLNTTLVACVDGRSVGFVAWRDKDDWRGSGYLAWLYVDPEFHQRGIGGRLLASAMAALGDQAWTLTRGGNAPALRLYQKHGMRIVFERPGDAWGYPMTEVRLALPTSRKADPDVPSFGA